MKNIGLTIVITLALITMAYFWYSNNVYQLDALTTLLFCCIVTGIVALIGVVLLKLKLRFPVWGWLLLIILIFAVSITLDIIFAGSVPPPLFYDESHATTKGLSFLSGTAVWSIRPDIAPARIMVQGQSVELLLGVWVKLTEITFENARFFWLILAWSGMPFLYLCAK